MTAGPVIAVIGAGFSGSLTALRLLQVGPPGARILLVEQRARFGRGVAYGAHNPNQLLNVRVGNMSALPEDPGHLRRWLQRRGDAAGEAAFITRGIFGDYIADQIREAVMAPDGAERLVLVPDRAVDLDLSDRGGRLHLAMGHRVAVDAAVLAVGNLPPQAPERAGLENLPRSLYAPDPWAPGALEGFAPDDDVMLLGSGLTMVDVSLDLAARGHVGRILALSRRGLVPHRHEAVPLFEPAPASLAGAPLSRLVHALRRRAQLVGWRAAVDELRPVTAAHWQAASLEQRQRFLRHLRPWWDIHRHRMAPVVGDAIDGLRKDGRLDVQAGRLLRAEVASDALQITWRPRGEKKLRRLNVGRIINCTGAGADLARTDDPLLRRLIDKGDVRPDALGLGLEVDAACRAVGRDGASNRKLYAAGPLTQGQFWESVAVPDIRNQVVELAASLTAALRTRSGRRDLRETIVEQGR